MGISALLASQILDASATGRSVITGADASAIRTTLGLGTLATQSATITDYLTIASAASTYQPLDSDLTSIAALSTTSFGRGLLTEVSASTARSTLGLGTLATQSPTGTPSASTFLRGDFSWQTIDLSGYVPYTGASGPVNLGSNAFTANAATFNSRVTINADILVQTSGLSPFVLSGGISGVNGRAKLGHASNTDGELSLRTLALSSNAGSARGDSFIHSDASDTLGIRNSTNAQRLNLYGTYTDASNYRRLFLSSTTAGAFTLGVEGAGTGASGNTFAISSNATVPRLGIGGGTHDLSTFRLHVIDSDSGAVGFYVQNTNATGGGVPRIAVAYGGTSAFGVTAWQNRSYIEDQGGNGLALGADNANVYIYGNRGNWNTGITVTSGSRILIGQNTDDGSTRVQINGAIKAAAATFSGNVTVSAVNIVTDTTTGTKIGTATTQKLGFYNATPVVQPTAVANATDAASVITQLNALLSRMRDLGLIAT